MKVIESRNAHTMLPNVLDALGQNSDHQETRNGPVKVFPGPVALVYREPTERVLFWAERDANPFFHFFEALWMLGGKNDVDFVSQFSRNIANYSDDGLTFHGAYGYRWRHHFERDQLDECIAALLKNPADRRVVLQMWDPRTDLGRQGKDFPCNLAITFTVNMGNRLDMTVFNRSNDIIWGAVGANVVHMTMLHEYVASWLRLVPGTYHQISTNMHAYLNTYEPLKDLAKMADDPYRGPTQSPYNNAEVEPFPMVSYSRSQQRESWDQDLEMFLGRGPTPGFRHKFFKRVAVPMWDAYAYYVNKDYEGALAKLGQCKATDWRRACAEWIGRRAIARRKAEDDGVKYD